MSVSSIASAVGRTSFFISTVFRKSSKSYILAPPFGEIIPQKER
nr:MAG TPA: hypothetical protein [Caudoviricetes sp.]